MGFVVLDKYMEVMYVPKVDLLDLLAEKVLIM